MGKRIDLTGQRFGRLVVEGFAYKDGRRYFWTCKCDCGQSKIVREDSLKVERLKAVDAYIVKWLRKL